MATESGVRSGGIGVTGALGVLFVGLKLGGVIDWSWWWVTAPFWAPLAIVLAVLVGVLAVLVGVLALAVLKSVTGRSR